MTIHSLRHIFAIPGLVAGRSCGRARQLQHRHHPWPATPRPAQYARWVGGACGQPSEAVVEVSTIVETEYCELLYASLPVGNNGTAGPF